MGPGVDDAIMQNLKLLILIKSLHVILIIKEAFFKTGLSISTMSLS